MSPATKTPGKTLRFWALIWVPRTLWWLLWKLQFPLCYPTPRLFFGLGDDGVRSNLGWVLGASRVEKHIAPVYSNTFDERAVIYTTEEIWMSDIQSLDGFRRFVFCWRAFEVNFETDLELVYATLFLSRNIQYLKNARIPFKSLLKPGRTDNAKCPALRIVIGLWPLWKQMSWSGHIKHLKSSCKTLQLAMVGSFELHTHTHGVHHDEHFWMRCWFIFLHDNAKKAFGAVHTLETYCILRPGNMVLVHASIWIGHRCIYIYILLINLQLAMLPCCWMFWLCRTRTSTIRTFQNLPEVGNPQQWLN